MKTGAHRSAILLGWIVLLAAGCNSSGASSDATGAAGAGGNTGSGGDAGLDMAPDLGAGGEVTPDLGADMAPNLGAVDAAPDVGTDATTLSCLTNVLVTNECDMTCPAGQYCWDFHVHDATCFGQICTLPCCSDQDCFDAYSNNPLAHRASCGADHLCMIVALGIGSFACQ